MNMDFIFADASRCPLREITSSNGIINTHLYAWGGTPRSFDDNCGIIRSILDRLNGLDMDSPTDVSRMMGACDILDIAEFKRAAVEARAFFVDLLVLFEKHRDTKLGWTYITAPMRKSGKIANW